MNTAKLKLLVGGVLIASGIAYMAYLSAEQTGQYALGVAEYSAGKDHYQGHGLRLMGLVPKDSWKAEGTHHTFRIVDDKDQVTVIPVTFDGTMPDTFAEERQVIVAGRIAADGTMAATEVIPQCASKYQPAPGQAAEAYKKYDHAKDEPNMPGRPGFGGTPPPVTTPGQSASIAPETVTR